MYKRWIAQYITHRPSLALHSSGCQFRIVNATGENPLPVSTRENATAMI